MEHKNIIDEKGRQYRALVEDDKQIILGPPEGLVDELGLPEPVATNLHNVLFRRGLMTFSDIAAGKNAIGALQEALGIDAQRLVEAYFKFEGGPK